MKPALLFRRAQAGDALMLTGIARTAKQHWGYPAEWMAEWRRELTVTPEYIRTQPVQVAGTVVGWRPPGVRPADGAASTGNGASTVGFFGLKVAETGWHLEHLWLQPEYIGRGLGRPLFAEAARQARAAGATELQIKSDPNAEPFYLKMGAVRTGLEVYLLLGRIRREVPLLVYKL